MSFESNRLLRASRLFWTALGPGRVYIASAIVAVLLLATIGLWHLISSATRSVASPNKAAARVSPGIGPSSPSSILHPPSSPSPPSPAAHELERAIAITEVTEAEERGPRGETFIVAKIGMASRTTAEKDNIEIRVLFFDLDSNNQMRPTDAQVTYQWITQVRDWTDPTPKYLAATYLKHHPSRHSREQLRYGGFLVRIYSDGKLQDERSQPESLVASLRSNAPQPVPTSDLRPPTSDSQMAPSPFRAPPATAPSPSAIVNPPSSPASSPPTPSNSPSSTLNPPSSPPDSLPKGIPIPGKPGFVQSPYDPKFIIDVRGFPPGTLVNDPNTNKPFRVP